MADPTPALPNGTADMMDPVSDGVDSAMPADIVTMGTSRMAYGVPAVTNENSSNPRAPRAIPSAMVRLSPMRAARRGPRGARNISVAAKGSWAMPAFSAS